MCHNFANFTQLRNLVPKSTRYYIFTNLESTILYLLRWPNLTAFLIRKSIRLTAVRSPSSNTMFDLPHESNGRSRRCRYFDFPNESQPAISTWLREGGREGGRLAPFPLEESSIWKWLSFLQPGRPEIPCRTVCVAFRGLLHKIVRFETSLPVNRFCFMKLGKITYQSMDVKLENALVLWILRRRRKAQRVFTHPGRSSK